jgi:hypothetical protein
MIEQASPSPDRVLKELISVILSLTISDGDLQMLRQLGGLIRATLSGEDLRDRCRILGRQK